MTEDERINDIIEGISYALVDGDISMQEAERRVKLLAGFTFGFITLQSLSYQFSMGEK